LDNVEESFHYGEACIKVTFIDNNKVLIHASTTTRHEFPSREYRVSLPLTDLVTWFGLRLPAQGTGSCRPIRVKGDLMMNIRTNAPPYINFNNYIIIRLGDEADDLVQYLNSEYIRRFTKGKHETKTYVKEK
jgi:hypothetical protein